MTDRDLRILELRKLGLSYSWIGREVGVSKVWVGKVIRRERPDWAGPLPYHRILTRQEVEHVLRFRRAGYSKEHIRRLTGIGWDVQQRIYKAVAPELVNLWRNQDAEVLLLHAAGLSSRAIARRTGKPKSTVGHIIKRAA